MTENTSKPKQKKTEQVNFRVSESLYSEFKQACEDQGLPMAFVHRQLMQDFIDNKKQMKLI